MYNEDAQVMGSILMICAIIFGVIVTNDEVITPKAFAHAEKLCEPNDGLKKVEIDLISYDVSCNNSAYFNFTYRESDKYGYDLFKKVETGE